MKKQTMMVAMLLSMLATTGLQGGRLSDAKELAGMKIDSIRAKVAGATDVARDVISVKAGKVRDAFSDFFSKLTKSRKKVDAALDAHEAIAQQAVQDLATASSEDAIDVASNQSESATEVVDAPKAKRSIRKTISDKFKSIADRFKRMKSAKKTMEEVGEHAHQEAEELHEKAEEARKDAEKAKEKEASGGEEEGGEKR